MTDGPPSVAPLTRPNPRAGELTAPWRVAMIVIWAMVFVSYMAVWKASKEIGIGTWWLGPRSDPQPTVVSLIPFVVAATVGAAAGYNIRHLPWISLCGSVAMALIAVPDLSRSTGLAVVEFAIAGSAFVFSLVSMTGTYRADSEASPGQRR